jgi:hypothetical protein
VTSKGKGLPRDVIAQWPEVFSEINVKAVPLNYLHSMRIIFKGGKTWNVNIASQAKAHGVDNLEEHLKELLSNYEHDIEHIDFRLDVDRVKKDIMKQTASFLKKKRRKKEE